MIFRTATIALLILCAFCAPASVFSALGFSSLYFAQTEKPEWCRNLPRPEYKSFEKVPLNDPWFEVYKVAPATFAIYEPHQAEEVISYLNRRHQASPSLDTGMGIGNIKAVVAHLTSRPIVVLNSHSHDRSRRGQLAIPFSFTAWTPPSVARMQKAPAKDAQAEIARGSNLRRPFQRISTRQIFHQALENLALRHDHFKVNLGGRGVEIISTPGPHARLHLAHRWRQRSPLHRRHVSTLAAKICALPPETDFPAYLASVRKLVALAPQVKLVLGSHNVPVAQPSVLAQLDAGIHAILAWKVQPQSVDGDQAIYQVGEISFRLHHPSSCAKIPSGPTDVRSSRQTAFSAPRSFFSPQYTPELCNRASKTERAGGKTRKQSKAPNAPSGISMAGLLLH